MALAPSVTRSSDMFLLRNIHTERAKSTIAYLETYISKAVPLNGLHITPFISFPVLM